MVVGSVGTLQSPPCTDRSEHWDLEVGRSVADVVGSTAGERAVASHRPGSAEDCGKRSQTLCVPSADSSSLQLLLAPSCGAQATAACSALSPACSWEETRTTEL